MGEGIHGELEDEDRGEEDVELVQFVNEFNECPLVSLEGKLHRRRRRRRWRRQQQQYYFCVVILLSCCVKGQLGPLANPSNGLSAIQPTQRLAAHPMIWQRRGSRTFRPYLISKELPPLFNLIINKLL